MKECGGKKETEMPDGALSIFGADPGCWERSKSLPEKRKPVDRAGFVDAGVELSPDLIWLIAADGQRKGIIAR